MKKHTKPTLSIIFKNHNLKVIALNGHKGDVLPNHKIDIPAILSVRSGKILYQEANNQTFINEGEYHLIPKDTVHNLSFDAESSLELITFSKSKIKFILP